MNETAIKSVIAIGLMLGIIFGVGMLTDSRPPVSEIRAYKITPYAGEPFEIEASLCLISFEEFGGYVECWEKGHKYPFFGGEARSMMAK